MSNMLSLAIYLTTFAISTVSVYFAVRAQNKIISVVLFLVAAFLPAGLAALRESGTDYLAYKSIYEYLVIFPFDYTVEYGWLFLNFISPSFEILLFISALLFSAFGLGGCMRVARRNTWLAWGAFLCIFYPIFLNVMRQMLAAAIVFYGFADLLKKRHAPYLICVLLAVFFHKTAILMAVAPLIVYASEKIKRIDIVLLAATAICISLLPALLIVVESLYGSESRYNTIVFEPNFGFLFYTLPPLAYYYWKRNNVEKDKRTNVLFALYFCCIPIQIIGLFIPYADRMILYFEPSIVLLASILSQDYPIVCDRRKIEWRYENEFLTEYVQRELVLDPYHRIWFGGSGRMRLCGDKATTPCGDYTIAKNSVWVKWCYAAWFIFYFLVMEFLMNGNRLFPYM